MLDNTVQYNWKERTILVVEDDSPNFQYFKSLLKKTGVNIIWKTNGNEALDYIKDMDNRIDLIIMDILIPFINGIDVTRESKKIRKDTPVIVVTAYSSNEVKQNSYLAGCDDYLIKPVLPAQLMSLIVNYFHQESTIESYQLS